MTKLIPRIASSRAGRKPRVQIILLSEILSRAGVVRDATTGHLILQARHCLRVVVIDVLEPGAASLLPPPDYRICSNSKLQLAYRKGAR